MTDTDHKALLLRVGIDRGTGGALGPIFDDGTFEYIPIPEREGTRERRSYGTLLGQHGRPLGDYLPRKLAALYPHIDPDFGTAIYGDAAPRKRRQLGKLMRGDVLVFYCGLVPSQSTDAPRLFAIGYLLVKGVHKLTASDLKKRSAVRRRFCRTAHFLRTTPDPELTLVEGDRNRSRLFNRALPFGDCCGNLLRDLDRLGYQGSIQRAVGHWVRGNSAMAFLRAWIQGGPTALIDSDSRLLIRPPSSIVHYKIGQDRDIEIALERPFLEVGDWFLVLSKGETTRVILFGRINRRNGASGYPRTFSSLFWHFAQNGPVVPRALRRLMLLKPLRHQPVIRKLVAWLAGRYRIGVVRTGIAKRPSPAGQQMLIAAQ